MMVLSGATMAVVRVLVCLFLTAALLFSAEAFKLYLKDGDYHMVREYKVDGDRVQYFSTERGEWEEIPKELCNLEKTDNERKQAQAMVQEERKQLSEEDQAERAQRKEIASIPQDAGAYYIDGEKIKNLTIADYKLVTSKKRQALKYLSPIPLVPGKASVLIEGDHSKFVLNESRPQFYFRLAKEEKFGIVRLTPKKTARIVENISIIPVANQSVEQPDEIAAFQQQMSDGLFKVWPEKSLTPGEYALVESSDDDEVALMIYDFAYRPDTVSKN